MRKIWRRALKIQCNPVFVTLSQRIGIDKFYEHLDSYGFTGTTGIDYPGEATSILQSKQSAGPVGLATISLRPGHRLYSDSADNGAEFFRK